MKHPLIYIVGAMAIGFGMGFYYACIGLTSVYTYRPLGETVKYFFTTETYVPAATNQMVLKNELKFYGSDFLPKNSTTNHYE